jgi:hypothetical protein
MRDVGRGVRAVVSRWLGHQARQRGQRGRQRPERLGVEMGGSGGLVQARRARLGQGGDALVLQAQVRLAHLRLLVDGTDVGQLLVDLLGQGRVAVVEGVLRQQVPGAGRGRVRGLQRQQRGCKVLHQRAGGAAAARELALDGRLPGPGLRRALGELVHLGARGEIGQGGDGAGQGEAVVGGRVVEGQHGLGELAQGGQVGAAHGGADERGAPGFHAGARRVRREPLHPGSHTLQRRELLGRPGHHGQRAGELGGPVDLGLPALAQRVDEGQRRLDGGLALQAAQLAQQGQRDRLVFRLAQLRLPAQRGLGQRLHMPERALHADPCRHHAGAERLGALGQRVPPGLDGLHGGLQLPGRHVLPAFDPLVVHDLRQAAARGRRHLGATELLVQLRATRQGQALALAAGHQLVQPDAPERRHRQPAHATPPSPCATHRSWALASARSTLYGALTTDISS